METIKEAYLTGERALFGSRDLAVAGCTFAEGESPLKESANITLTDCTFQWKYPLWYCRDIQVSRSTWLETARAGVWYTRNVTVEDSEIEAPKNFRRCQGVTLRRVNFPHAEETLWHCRGVVLEEVTAKGPYFAMNSENIRVRGFTLHGDYPFDGVKNAEIREAELFSKDAFWNCENVTVYDSYITGEYLGWNAKNLTFVNCTLESLQGLCYIDNLVMKNCILKNTTLAFEYSTVEADIHSHIDSVLNPSGGAITADSIGELTIEQDKVDPGKTRIICRNSKEV